MSLLVRFFSASALAIALAAAPVSALQAVAQTKTRTAPPAPKPAPPPLAKSFVNAAWADRSVRPAPAQSKPVTAVQTRKPPATTVKPDFKNMKPVVQTARPNAGGKALTLKERGQNLADKTGNSMTYKTSPTRGANANLAGASHGRIATPHVHERSYHTAPDGKAANWKREAVPRRATSADIRLAERVAQRRARPR